MVEKATHMMVLDFTVDILL